MNEAKELLKKQLELLSNLSEKNVTVAEAVELSNAIEKIATAIEKMDDGLGKPEEGSTTCPEPQGKSYSKQLKGILDILTEAKFTANEAKTVLSDASQAIDNLSVVQKLEVEIKETDFMFWR